MRVTHHNVSVSTRGRGTYPVTAQVRDCLALSDVYNGLCHVFIQHTSASLLVTENADPDVRRDLDTFAADWVPDGDARFLHQDEGPDDMAAHLRSAFTATSLSIPLVNGQLALGIWQGLFVWEHRYDAHRRQLVITVMGETA